jgi:hypothetical protein
MAGLWRTRSASNTKIKIGFAGMSEPPRLGPREFPRRGSCGAVLAVLALLAACGGGGGQSGGGGNPPPAPDFELSFNPPSISIPAGGKAQTNLAAIALNGLASQVSIQFSGLPAGVTASPPNPTLIPGTPQTITFSAASNSAAAIVTAAATGRDGGLSHSANLSLTVTASGGVTGPPLNTRTGYLRTDAVTEYYLSLNDHWIVFHSATSRIFVTDPFGNQVIVVDSVARKRIATIAVPGAWGMDDTPDHSVLYVGTLLGDVYAIDPVAMKISRRYIASEIGPYGYQALSTLVMADGRLALLGEQGGIPSVDGSTGIAIWSPTTNSITIYGSANSLNSGGIPTQPLCPMGNIGGFTRTADRTSVLLGSIDSDGTLCEIAESTGQTQYVVGSGSSMHIAVSPDGNYLALPGANGSVTLFNPRTLTLGLNFPVSANVSPGGGMAFSPDSKTLYISGSEFVYAYGVADGQLIGWLPNLVVQYISGGLEMTNATGPAFGAFDGTGLLVGPMEEGLGFLDTTQFRSGTLGTGFLNGYLTPATGPASGGTGIQLPDPNNFGALSGMYFGSQPATNVGGNSGIISANTPAGTPGPADVYVLTNDGGMQIIPDGFSYGPTILEVSPNVSTAEGGGIGVVYGYGFGDVNATTIPTGLSVSVGGRVAQITGFSPNAYNLSSPPFLSQAFAYKVPAGTSGSAADLTITTTAGVSTSTSAMTYLPSIQQFPLAGAQLVQGIYDHVRGLYYFTDANQIQVFSRASGRWLSPIRIPAPSGGALQRLWGLALSPDGSKLAIADINADVIYLLNPSNTASVQTFPFAPSLLAQGIVANPAGIAITDTGIAYIEADVLGGTGFSNYFKLDTNTGILTNLNLVGPGLGTSDSYLRTELSSDNTRVYFNSFGAVFSLDTSTGLVTQASSNQGCCYGNYELALAANQTQVAGSAYLYDADLNGESFLTLNDRESANVSYVYGAKLSPDGSLLFQPSVSGMDIFDGRTGILRERVALPVDLSPNYDALVEDGEDNVLVAITGANGNGVAILDFSSVSEPPPLGYPNVVTSGSNLRDAVSTRDRESTRPKHEAHSSGPRSRTYVTTTRPVPPH